MKLYKYIFKHILILIIVFFNRCNEENKNIKKPNILFISIDDLNDWTGYIGGHPQGKTPNIDKLAKKGIAFTNAYSSAPLCNPSRISLLSGILPSNSGVYGNKEKFREKLPHAQTLMQYLKKNGYKTMGGGKIFHGYNNPGDSLSWDYYHKVQRNSGTRKTDGMFEERYNGRDPKLPHRSIFRWGPIDIDDEEMADVKVAYWVISELQKKQEKPFFLAYGLSKPHLPWYVPRKYFDKFPLEEIILPKTIDNDLDDIPPFGKKLAEEVYIVSSGENFNIASGNEHHLTLKNSQWSKGVQAYLATINFADTYVGKVLDALENSKYAKNTIVVLWGDHGWHLGEKSHWRKHALWEDTTRTPLIFYYPDKIENGSSISNPISFIDIYPTLIEMCGLPEKKDLDGKSFLSLLKNPRKNWDKPALMTFGKGNHAVRAGEWRYIEYYDGTNELYNHDNDPNEWYNLSDLKENKTIISKLKKTIPILEKEQTFSHNNNSSKVVNR